MYTVYVIFRTCMQVTLTSPELCCIFKIIRILSSPLFCFLCFGEGGLARAPLAHLVVSTAVVHAPITTL